ncbi:MAG: hypothetical protein AB3N20_07410 [Rhizobiaceae bacterium]
MRKFFVLLGIIGLALAIAYPFVVQNFGGYRIGSHEVFSPGGGFKSIEVELSDEEDPVRILVDYHSSTQVNAVMASATLAMSVEREGGRVLSKELEFTHSTPGEDSVQSGSYVYRATGGVIHPVGVETYRFSFQQTAEAALKPDRIELILMASAIEWDPRGQLLGYVLLAAGMIGFVISTVGRGKKKNTEPPKWGRGESDANE